MKYNCPTVLQSMLEETQCKISEYQSLAGRDVVDFVDAKRLRTAKDETRRKIEQLVSAQSPLKWVDRVIMWCGEP